MLLTNLSFFLLAFVAAAVSGEGKSSSSKHELEWPEKYSFEITKINLASGLVEDINIWRTEKESRVEYNHGAVKSFVVKGKSRSSRGYAYEIHPETYGESEENKIVCHTRRLSRWDSGPVDVLPAIDDFEEVGEEMMKDQECTKFFKESVDGKIESKHTLWAFYDTRVKAWVPTRYMLEEFNTWLGYIDRRDMWDFENFNINFDEKEIFNADSMCEEDDPIRHMKDERVTKHLVFIDPENEDHVDHVFKAFKKNHNKKYAHDDEHQMRRRIFQRNLRLIKSTNSKNLGYKLTVNHFADRTPEEMKRYTGLLRRPEGKVGTHPFPYTTAKLGEEASKLPSVYDLRLEGVISPVQNQETCGSCWTFGTTSAVEGALARSNGGRLMRLSNQALVDCAWEFGAAGCDGGTDNAAYEWMMKYGLPTIADYGTYENQDGYCHIQNVSKTYKISGYVDVTPNSIQALKVALVNHGPLSVSVHVTSAFALYSGGVFYDFECNPMNLNHEITLVGYGEEYGETFWIVKNSWGQDWGIDGFMHIAAKENNCGIMTEPTYVMF
ncbi:cathepsin K-like [Pectinophora gossypiella]|uniref:cathepsin K-like n=1 Tax=Pectinophora gossypiella TaxID=13191 RepID=UPI00214E90DE|nr:cathepsin K-like [Pectinophora gossypiella]